MADKNVLGYGRKAARREQIAWLYYHERKNSTEIAKELGITKQAVCKALKPERTKLRQETALVYELNHQKLLELVSDIYQKAIKAYAISQGIVKEETVEDQSGKKLKVYFCDQSAELSGDPRFLEIALKSIDRLIALHEGNMTVSMMKQASSENSFWNKARKVLEEYIQETTQVQAKPAQPPSLSSPSSSSPNALPSLPNFSQNGSTASPNLQDSAALSIPTTASTSDSDDEIVKFAKQSGIPESIVRIEFKVIQLLYDVSYKDIINRYHTLSMPVLLPILKLRYIRCFWKQLSQNSESNFSKQSRSNTDNAGW